MEHYIVTGTSRGIGRALVLSLLRSGKTIHSISRSGIGQQTDLPSEGKIYEYKFDLMETKGIPELTEHIFHNIDPVTSTAITLINNAGVIEPVRPAHMNTIDEIGEHFNINFLAPVALSVEFIRRTENFAGRRMVVNISSGAAKNPYHGWSSYCSGKAALEMFSRCTGLEHIDKDNPVMILSLAPGIVETGMQETIRGTHPDHFPQKHKFIRYKEEGHLKTPEETAQKLLSFLDKEDLVSGGCYDLRDH
jgi:benzil reductase ((S)-benzoin forming)